MREILFRSLGGVVWIGPTRLEAQADSQRRIPFE